MKKTSVLILSFLLAATLTTPVMAEEDEKIELEEVGMNIAFPEEVQNSQGYLQPYPIGVIDSMHHVYMMTYIYEGMPYDQAEEMMYSGDLTAEQQEELMAKQYLLTVVLATDKDLETALEAVDRMMPDDMAMDTEAAEEIGSADGYTFYTMPMLSDEFLSRLDEEYAAEYKELEQILLDAERNADLYAPDDPDKEMSGQKVEFTTTDIDGNTITSEELFAENEITMVNCWGLWCPHCINEIGELAEIHNRMQEKGCGILGLEYEKESTEETYQEAAAFLDENGVTYPNVILPEELLPQISGFPFSFFVNKEGTVVGMPISGAQVSEYERALDMILSGDASGSTEADDADADEAVAEADDAETDGTVAEADDAETDGTAAAATYHVTVTDENGPVEGVAIQFCDDTTCSFVFTDADGLAFLEGTAGSDYDVHVLKVPDGYQDDETIYHFTDSSELTIQLQKDN